MSDFKNMFQETAEEESSFALIEQGEYEAEISDAKLDLTKSPERLSVVYTITEGENQGRKLFGNYQLEGRGIGFLKKDLKTLGLDFSEINSPEDIADLIWNAMPIPVVIFVNQKEYKGKMYNNCYLNSVLTDSAHTIAKEPTNQKEAERQARVNNPPPQQEAKQAPAGRAAPPNLAPKATTKPAAKSPPPSGRAQTSRTPPPKTAAKRRAGEPDFGDTDEVPF